MKKLLSALATLTLTVIAFTARADVIAQWNFNYPLDSTSSSSDDSVLTGTNAPCIGNGTWTLVGGATLQGYDTGSPNCPPCDPFYQFTANNPKTGPNTNNSAMSVTNFPVQGTGNKTTGIEVSFSTVGYTNISVSWEQRHQQRSCKYFRLQYSVNGADFVDVPSEQGGVISIGTQNIFFPQTNHLSSVNSGIENNPNAKIRLVAEFESTAIIGGSQGDNYVASVQNTAAEYRKESEMRLDMFTIWGDSTGAPTDEVPTISVDSPTLNTIGSAPVTNTFTIGDAETPVDSLIVTATSGNPNLVTDANIQFLDTTGANRRVKVTPSPACDNPSGSATITLKVTDGIGQMSTANFSVDVQSGVPDIQNVSDVGMLINTTAMNSLTLVDSNTDASALTFNSTNSSITTVLANAGISTSGTGSSRTVTMTPEQNALGGTIVSLGVTDGECSDTNSFLLMVVPQSDVILYESFDHYPDGPLTTSASGGVWLNVADTPGAIAVSSQALRLSTTNEEEYVRCPLIGRGTYLSSGSAPLYAKMNVTLLSLPASPFPTINTQLGNFSGPGTPGAQRARFFASIDGADTGYYRFGISGGQNVPSAYLATNLLPNVTYTVVTYYSPTSGVARLWVDPTSESDPFVEAAETQTGDIAFYAFRQKNAGVDAIIDDLVVATSFNGALLIPPPELKAAIVNGHVEISWPIAGSEGASLYSNSDLNTTDWQLVTETPTEESGRYIVTITNPTGNQFYRLQK